MGVLDSNLSDLLLPDSVLFVVNEPGEFRELLKVAGALEARGASSFIFLFCRPDYVAFSAHSDICSARGYKAVLANPKFSLGDILNYLHPAFQNDYVPTSLTLAGLSERIKLSKLNKIPNSRSLMGWAVFEGLLRLPKWLATTLRPKSRTKGMLDQVTAVRPIALRYRAMKSYFYAICKLEKIDTVIFGQDYAGSFNSVASLVAEKVLKIPVITVPFAMGTTKELNEALFYYPTFRADADRFSRAVAKKYPRWVNVYKGKRLLRLPPSEIVAAELEGATAPYPWLPYSGRGYFLAASQQSADYYSGSGMDEKQIYVTGSFNDKIWSSSEGEPDAVEVGFSSRRLSALRWRDSVRQKKGAFIADAIGRRLENEGGAGDRDLQAGESSDFLASMITSPIDRFELNKRQIVAANALADMEIRRERAGENDSISESRLIVVSWPTNQFSRPIPGLEFQSHEDVSRFWAQSIYDAAQEHGAMVMVSLHPTLLGQDYGWLEHEFGFTIWPRALTDIIPEADVFVSCVSSTLLWAANLGVPSINYDCYRYGYREFDETGAIVTASSKSRFVELLDQILTDDKFYGDLKSGAEKSRGYWGFFDGKSEARIVEAISDIYTKRVQKRGVKSKVLGRKGKISDDER